MSVVAGTSCGGSGHSGERALERVSAVRAYVERARGQAAGDGPEREVGRLVAVLEGAGDEARPA